MNKIIITKLMITECKDVKKREEMYLQYRAQVSKAKRDAKKLEKQKLKNMDDDGVTYLIPREKTEPTNFEYEKPKDDINYYLEAKRSRCFPDRPRKEEEIIDPELIAAKEYRDNKNKVIYEQQLALKQKAQEIRKKNYAMDLQNKEKRKALLDSMTEEERQEEIRKSKKPFIKDYPFKI